MKKIAPVLMLILLAACTTVGEKRTGSLNLSGFPPEYRRAFVDGCDRAIAGGKVTEMPSASGGGTLVAQGWRDGFDYCRAHPR